jgi:probable phosphoglycerate mutase
MYREGDVGHPASSLDPPQGTGEREFTLDAMTEKLFADLEPAERPADSWYTAHCDGGSRGNPGPAGYGAVIEDPKGKTVARLSEFLGRQTNNFAEYKGLLSVLAWAKQHGARQLRVVSDSELMVKQMKGQYKVASPGLRPLWEEAKRLARELDRFEMRHTLRGGNQEADSLANEAMDKGMGRPPVDNPSGLAASPKAAHEQPKSMPRPPRQILEGFVKNGVVHLLNGELPEGTFVKVTRE